MTLTERLDAARRGAAVGPVQRRAFLCAQGPDAQDLLHRLSTQELRALAPGQSAYTAFLDPKGHLLGEGLLLVGDGEVLMALEPAALAATRDHLEKLVIMDDVTFEDRSGALRALPLFGAEGGALADAAAAGAPRVPTTRRGAPCVELWLPAAGAEQARAELVAKGAIPLSDEDLEVLRVLGGVPRYGADMDATRLPMEAGLTREAISFKKGCYVGQETVMRATARGHLQRGLVQLELPPGTAAGAPLSAGGQEVGAVTSAVDGPEGRIGLGHVRRPYWPDGTRLATGGGEAVVVRAIVWEPG